MVKSSIASLFRPRNLILMGMVCSALGVLTLLYLHFSRSGAVPGWSMAGHYVASIVLMNVCGGLALLIDYWLDQKISWKDSFLARLLTGSAVNTVMLLAVGLGLTNVLMEISPEDATKLVILGVISVLVYEVGYGWFYSYRYYAHHQVEWLRSERWQMELQFESLKSQISPHFLFNCLNTISSLLYKDTRLAEEFIRRMADTFQYVLDHQRRTFVTLREELEFVKSYYYLLQVRFENNLKLEINVPKNLLDTFVPPLTLQMLVENAVKHNQISATQPLLVYINSRDNTHVLITNTRTTATQAPEGFRVGLDNIRKRYAFFTSQPVQVRNEERYTVELPVLREMKPVSVEA